MFPFWVGGLQSTCRHHGDRQGSPWTRELQPQGQPLLSGKHGVSEAPRRGTPTSVLLRSWYLDLPDCAWGQSGSGKLSRVLEPGPAPTVLPLSRRRTQSGPAAPDFPPSIPLLPPSCNRANVEVALVIVFLSLFLSTYCIPGNKSRSTLKIQIQC